MFAAHVGEMAMNRLILISLVGGMLTAADLAPTHDTTENPKWPRHVVAQGYDADTAIAGDVTGDGKADIITNFNGHTRLFVGPDFKQQVILDETADGMHSELIDVDGDGDLDYIGCVCATGPVYWLENPADPLKGVWTRRLVDGNVTGVHGLMKGDIDGDGKLDIVGNSSLLDNDYPESVLWWSVPANPRTAAHWDRHVVAQGDAPGRSHYVGAGDLNGDGLMDITAAAKNEPEGNWFAWWEQPANRSTPWRKHVLAEDEYGATSVQPGDFNGDGVMDLLAARGHGTGLLWFEGPNFVKHQVNEDLVAPHSLTLGDIDGDGDLDAASVARLSFVAAWFENDGNGKFTTHHIYDDQAAYDARLVDLDGDGDLDLLVAGDIGLNVVWYENRLQN
jgi:hypothetical protein